MRFHAIAPVLMAALLATAPLGAQTPARSHVAGNFQLALDGEDAGWIRSAYARQSGGKAIADGQLRAYLQHMQVDGWDRARVEQDISASLPAPKQSIPAQPNMRVRCSGKPLRCGSVPAAGEKEKGTAAP